MTSGSTREFMAMCAIAQHFARPGTPTDQAWIESLFSHIKADWPHLDAIRDPAVLRPSSRRPRRVHTSACRRLARHRDEPRAGSSRARWSGGAALLGSWLERQARRARGAPFAEPLRLGAPGGSRSPWPQAASARMTRASRVAC